MIYFSNFSEDEKTNNNNYASASLISEFYPCVNKNPKHYCC